MNTQLAGAIALSLSAATATAQWTQATPAASPTARSGSALCSTPAGDALLFGGNLPLGATAETHRYDGTTWTALTNVGAPSARANMDLVYDPNAGVFRMYGGAQAGFISTTVFDQTWEMVLSGTTATWAQNVIVGPTPGGLYLHTTSYDTVHDVMVVHGGLPDGFFPIDSDRTWEFDGTSWTETAITPAVNPGPLERAAMCFHPGIGRTVLFGGIDVQTGGTDKTWTYDAGANTWTEVAAGAVAKPAARTGAKLAYDPLRDVCVLTGGADPSDPTGQTYFADTWEFDGHTWTQVAAGATPARLDASLAFVAAQNRLVLFGGVDFSTFTFHSDTWHWETGTFGSGCAGTNGTPHLSVSGSPRLGQSWTVTAHDVNSSINAGVLVFGFAELPGIDLGPILGMPGCLAFTTPDVLTSLLTGAGGSFSWTWPVVSGAPGDHFHGQALCIDPTVNAFGFTISNAISVTVGP